MIINMPWLIRKPDYTGSRNFAKIVQFALWVITLCVIVPVLLLMLSMYLVLWTFKLHEDEYGNSVSSHIQIPQFLWNEDHYLIAYHATMGFDDAKDIWYESVPVV